MDHDKSNGKKKFAGFDEMIASAKRDNIRAVLIHHPAVLGDTYEELVMNLDKLATAQLLLHIVPPKERK